MKLLAKFSLIFVTVFGVGLGSFAYVFYRLLQENARAEVLHQASLMMDSALAIRTYTTDQIVPALKECRELTPPAKREFRPAIVPAFAATDYFARLRKSYPDYYYKEASPNPTNPRNHVADWEDDVIRTLKARPDLKVLEGARDTPVGQSLFLAKPLRPPKECLECHSTPEAAPPEMVRVYGRVNGFGWTAGDVMAAQIVSIPDSLPVARANRAFRHVIVTLVIVCVVALVVLDLLLYFAVVRPVSALSAQAEEISRGDLDLPELPVRGKDEISVLALAFNRMHRSIKASIEMLDSADRAPPGDPKA